MTLLQWVRECSEFIPEMTEIPLFGHAPEFDIQHLSSILAARLEAKDFSLKLGAQNWKTPEAINETLQGDSFIASIIVHPFNVSLHFIISRPDLDKFTAWIMHQSGKPLISEPLKEGFFRFLLLEVLDAACQIDPLQKFTLQLAEKSEISQEKMFSIDFEVSFHETSCWGNLLIPLSFRKKWVEYFSQTSVAYASNKMAQATEVIVGVKTGSIHMTQTEWDSLKIGDFLILDQNSYDARKSSGIATLNLGMNSLFQVKIKQNKLEILDSALTQEELMEENNTLNESLEPADESNISIQEIPLNVCIELARLKMPLKRLTLLSPGNILELPIHPDQGVSLTVNGKKVGRAELVYLGETLAIRILELGRNE